VANPEYDLVPAVKHVLILEKESENDTCLNQLKVRNLLVTSVSRISDELQLLNVVDDLAIANYGLNVLCLNASPTLVFGDDDQGFLEDGVI
jgi:hypothetical protein